MSKKPTYDDLKSEVEKLKNELRSLKSTPKTTQSTIKHPAIVEQLFLYNKSAILLIDIENNTFIDANEAACKFYSYSKDELIQLSPNQIGDFQSLYTPNDNKVYYFDVQKHKNKFGDEIKVEIHSSLLPYKEKKILYAIVYNINTRQQFEAELNESRTQLEQQIKEVFELNKNLIDANSQIKIVNNILKEKENYLQSILKAAPVGIGVVRNGIIEFANEKLSEITGYNELSEQDIKELHSDKANAGKIWEEMHGRHVNIEEFETKWKSKDGTEKDILLSTTYIDENSPKSGITFAALDITRSKKAQRELILAKERAEASDKLKSAFLANISHEIRTPMNGILGFAELLNQDNLKPEKRRYFTNLINESSNQLLSIVTNIMDISKIQARQLEASENEFELNEIMDTVYRDYNDKLKKLNKEHIELNLEKGNEHGEVEMRTDLDKLMKVFTHLLDNAIKFTIEGQIELGYVINKDNEVQFFVKDSGIGIPAGKIDYVFQAFTQIDYDATRQYGGTGLGLSISKGFVELMGGKIWIVSEDGMGTTIYFTIPGLTNQTSAYDDKETKTNSKKYNWKNNHILIVEDDILNYFFLEESLEKTYIQISHAHSGLEAIDFCRNIDFDLILLDIQLPEMNGYDAAKEIRKFNTNVPIIAQTANAMSEDKSKCIEAGCNDYLSKPISIKGLLNVMHTYLDDK